MTMFQCYIAPERIICRRQFQTILASNELCREGFCFHGSIVSHVNLECFRRFFLGMTALRRLEMSGCLTMLMSSFIVSLFCSNKRCFLTLIK